MNDPLVDPNDYEMQLLEQRVRLAPFYVAIATAMVALWLYLVVGEFVLAGVPEWLGWTTVLLTAGSYYWAQARRLSLYMTNNTLRQRAITLLVICLTIVAAVLAAIILGLLLPEPVVTLVLFVLVGFAARWKRGLRLRLYATLWQDEGKLRLWKFASVGMFTILALGALVARQ